MLPTDSRRLSPLLRQDASRQARAERGVAGIALLLALSGLLPTRASADRYAVVIGNNQGARAEARLAYAEEDAEKVARVLKELGGVAAENLVLLQGDRVEDARRAIILVNERIRMSGKPSTLVVYYSGHANAKALHLGSTSFAFDELERLVRGSPAAMRMLVVDACRSGSLTRVKGGRSAPPFAIDLHAAPPSEGAVFLTSTAANEAAQESDSLRGSFFTHYFVSGLLGPADFDRDGAVSVSEIYRYAYDNTLRASSETWAGLQHPTYRYDLAGKTDFVLTRPAAARATRGTLSFPPGRDYLVFSRDLYGPVVAEVGRRDRVRHLSLKPGTYFVRGRTSDSLVQGSVQVASGAPVLFRDEEMERLEYAKLVRKGGEDAPDVAHGVAGGFRLRSSLFGDSTSCYGAFVGYTLDLPFITLAARLGACTESMNIARPSLDAVQREYDLTIRGTHAFDFWVMTFELGLELGGSLLHQTMSGDAPVAEPTRWSGALQVGAVAVLGVNLPWGFSLGIELALQTYAFLQRRELRYGDQIDEIDELTATFAVRPALVVGKRF